jgi:hypothetical protein
VLDDETLAALSDKTVGAILTRESQNTQPPGYDSAPWWPMAMIRECNFMEPEVCPWRILRTPHRRRSGKFAKLQSYTERYAY